MIHKSYIVEEDINVLKNNLILIYGENTGLIDELKNKIIIQDKKNQIIRLTQEEVLKNENILFNEINNISLFGGEKTIFINNANDKIIKIIEKIFPEINQNKIVILSNLLDKKSLLRKFFEKKTNTDLIACYQDDAQKIKKIIINELKEYTGLTQDIITIISENCSNNRIKLKNEIEKIKIYFKDKIIKEKELLKLINAKEEENFNILRDTSLDGNKIKTNNFLNNTLLDTDKMMFYISSYNLRFLKLKEVTMKKNTDLIYAVNNLKPPIFWKDKANFVNQAKIWNAKKIVEALEKSYSLETKIKSNSQINKEVLLRKFIVDICNLANAA